MTQEVALLRFRAARAHRECDATAMVRIARHIVDTARERIDDPQSTFVNRVMHELLGDAGAAMRRMGEADAEAAAILAAVEKDMAAIRGEMFCAVQMIERNPADSLDQRPASRRVLRTLLDMEGTPATIEEIAERSGLEVRATHNIMHAIHGHGFAVLQKADGVRRYVLSMKGTRPSLFAPDKIALEHQMAIRTNTVAFDSSKSSFSAQSASREAFRH